MKSLILGHIEFRYCYYCLLATIGSIIISFILSPIKLIPEGTLKVPREILGFLLGLYVNLGYVKYSYIEEEAKFRKIIFVVIILSILSSWFSILAPLFDFDQTKSSLYFTIPMIPLALVLFYAFRLIKTGEILYFRKLSRLYLYLFFIGALASLLFIPHLANYLAILIYFLLPAAFITWGLVFYWEIKLFRHLSKKEKHQLNTNLTTAST
jgi:hypothetical protein